MELATIWVYKEYGWLSGLSQSKTDKYAYLIYMCNIKSWSKWKEQSSVVWWLSGSCWGVSKIDDVGQKLSVLIKWLTPWVEPITSSKLKYLLKSLSSTIIIIKDKVSKYKFWDDILSSKHQTLKSKIGLCKVHSWLHIFVQNKTRPASSKTKQNKHTNMFLRPCLAKHGDPI